jgi:hypothetical protein
MFKSPGQPFKSRTFTRAFACLLLIALVATASCKKLTSRKTAEEKEAEETPVARVYDRYLYQADLKGVGANAATPEDSITAVKNYIDRWIRQELILRYAKENLPEELEDIEAQVERYRQQLIVYTYERELVAQKLDTAVSTADIQQYYDKYKDAFALKTPLFNLKYARLRNAPRARLDSVKRWMQKPGYENNSKLTNFCRQYAVRYEASDTAWFAKDEIAAVFPIERIDWETVGYRNGFAETQDSTDLCMIKVLGFNFKGAQAPLAYVRNDIYNIIVNKRKLDYIDRVHTAIYDDALKSKKFETY